MLSCLGTSSAVSSTVGSDRPKSYDILHYETLFEIDYTILRHQLRQREVESGGSLSLPPKTEPLTDASHMSFTSTNANLHPPKKTFENLFGLTLQ